MRLLPVRACRPRRAQAYQRRGTQPSGHDTGGNRGVRALRISPLQDDHRARQFHAQLRSGSVGQSKLCAARWIRQIRRRVESVASRLDPTAGKAAWTRVSRRLTLTRRFVEDLLHRCLTEGMSLRATSRLSKIATARRPAQNPVRRSRPARPQHWH